MVEGARYCGSDGERAAAPLSPLYEDAVLL